MQSWNTNVSPLYCSNLQIIKCIFKSSAGIGVPLASCDLQLSQSFKSPHDWQQWLFNLAAHQNHLERFFFISQCPQCSLEQLSQNMWNLGISIYFNFLDDSSAQQSLRTLCQGQQDFGSLLSHIESSPEAAARNRLSPGYRCPGATCPNSLGDPAAPLGHTC